MELKNTQTQEIATVQRLVKNGNDLFSVIYRDKTDSFKKPGRLFLENNKMLVYNGLETPEGYPVLTLAEGWEVATGKHAAKPQPQKKDNETAEKLFNLIAGIKTNTGSCDEGQVKKIVLETIAELSETQTKKIAAIAAAKVSVGCKYADYDAILQDVADGFAVYLHGPAGCGKSHTAEQIAADLNLPLYSATTLQFAHDVKGYGNAAGKYVETAFYKAFTEGGIYFLDEADRSLPDATIVLNTALAQRWFDFPVVGKKTAHENFRFIAAGNTKMSGADSEYVTGMVQDASFRNRFSAFYGLDYCREIELQIAGNNPEIVDFVEDVRNALKKIGLKHIVSYRETRYAAARESKKNQVLKNCIFKGIEIDDLRQIYGALEIKSNAWAQELQNIVK